MTYDVLVKRTNGRFMATVLGLPDCTVEAPTRAEAIRRARAAAAKFVAEGELVQIEVAPLTPARPLSAFVGIWADDETFDEFVSAMATYRRDIEADPTQP